MFFKQSNKPAEQHNYDYDLIIIGSGAGGSVGAHYARSLGKKVAIFERGDIGGECPNWACVPTKALLKAADVYENAKNAKEFGIHTGEVAFDYSQVKKWKDTVVSRTGVAHGEASFKEDGIDIIRENAQFVSPHEVEAGGKIYSAQFFIVATGSYVFIPPIEGLADAYYITFKQAVDFDQVPKSIFILGGGPIGCEFAQIFSTFGSKVIICDIAEKLLLNEDDEASEITEALFKERGITVVTGATIKQIEAHADKKIIQVSIGEESHTFDVEQLLVATGKRPVLDFAPEKAGILVDKTHIPVNEYLQTNVPHIFAAGDNTGPYLFTHTGYYQSRTAAINMFSNEKVRSDYTVVPRCVFIKPEIASVGMGENAAKKAGKSVKVGLCALSVLGRANTSNEFNGFIKIITDTQENIIGACIVGPHAGELIHELALAIHLKAKAFQIATMMHAYPTFAEGVKIAASSLEKRF